MDIPETLLRKSVHRGSILHSTMFEDIDHGKFFVVIGVTEEYIAGFFFINSRINQYIWNKKEQMAMQYLIHHKDYDFLKYDSFVSAVKIQQVKVERLTDSMRNGDTKIVGTLTEEDLKNLLLMSRSSKLFSKREKMLFLYE